MEEEGNRLDGGRLRGPGAEWTASTPYVSPPQSLGAPCPSFSLAYATARSVPPHPRIQLGPPSSPLFHYSSLSLSTEPVLLFFSCGSSFVRFFAFLAAGRGGGRGFRVLGLSNWIASASRPRRIGVRPNGKWASIHLTFFLHRVRFLFPGNVGYAHAVRARRGPVASGEGAELRSASEPELTEVPQLWFCKWRQWRLYLLDVHGFLGEICRPGRSGA